MKLRVAVSLSAALWAGPALRAAAQQPPAPGAVAPLPPGELFARARAEIADGRYDVAAETLKKFLAANPTDADYLAVTNREPTAFLKLRNVVAWSDEPAANAAGKATAEAVIAAAEAANKKFLRDPARIEKFVRNLGESPEERTYAEQQLRLSGDAVAPVLVDQLRTTTDPQLRAGVVGAVAKLNADQLPGLLAAASGLPPELRLGILRAAVSRGDAQNLSAAPDTDLLPHLWYYAAARGVELNALREFAALTLDAWTGGTSARKSAAAELVGLARPLAARQGRFRGADPVKLWRFDPASQAVSAVDATAAQANDYYALRNVRWALERNPGNPDATELFLATAVERSVERTQFGNVLQADPALLPVLAAAPSDTLIPMLDRALSANRTALALGLTQILSSRSDKAAAGVFVRGLDYPDARVQLAAAVGLLRVPGAVPAGKAARVVDILRRAAAVEPPAAGTAEIGRALIADPDDFRADRLARYLRQLGYGAERYTTGRALARRVGAAADADFVFVDRHVVNPELADILPALRASADAARRPVFVVASPDRVAPPPVDRLLLRLAYLVAVTETSELQPPPPFAYDPVRPVKPGEEENVRAARIASRDKILGELYRLRLARLERLVAGAEFPAGEALGALLDLRLPQLTYAALAAEYPVSATSAPETYRQLTTQTTALAANPRLVAATGGLRADALSKVVEDLDGALDARRRAQLEGMLARTDAAALAIPKEPPADPVADLRLERLVRSVGGVTVIAEPASVLALKDDIAKAAADPSRLPTPSAVKTQNARLAVEYLRRMAVGEITGFDIRPAEAALRAALKDDALAPLAADAVARIGTAEAQQDLLAVVAGVGRPPALKLLAADRAIQHARTFGRLVPAAQLQVLAASVPAVKDPELLARIAVLRELLSPRPSDLTELITKFPLPVPQPAPGPQPAPAPPAAEKVPEGAAKN